MKSDLRARAASTALGIVAAVVLDQFMDRYLAVLLAVLVGLATWWLTGLIGPRGQASPGSSEPGEPG